MRTVFGRRKFIKTSIVGAAGIVILKDSRSVGAYLANEKLNIASIGVCGQGESNLGAVGGENIVALCDADERRADPAGKRFPNAKRYADFRKMLDELHRRDRRRRGQHAGPHPRRGRGGGHEAGQTRLLREAPGTHRPRRRAHAPDRHRAKGRHADGQPRLGHRGICGAAVELAWAGVMGEMREAHIWLANGDGPQERPKDEPPVPDGTALGPVAWPGAPASLSPGLCARLLAALAGLWQRLRRRHGLPHDRTWPSGR